MNWSDSYPRGLKLATSRSPKDKRNDCKRYLVRRADHTRGSSGRGATRLRASAASELNTRDTSTLECSTGFFHHLSTVCPYTRTRYDSSNMAMSLHCIQIRQPYLALWRGETWLRNEMHRSQPSCISNNQTSSAFGRESSRPTRRSASLLC